MISWLVSILTLGSLVLVHEWGHFLVARWSGVNVLRFSIGFGPVLTRWKRGDTEYVLSLLPLGGYVKMAGEQGTGQPPAPNGASRVSATGSDIAPKQPLAKADEFSAQRAGVRARIVLAGPAVNYLVSIVALWTVLVVGYPELLPQVGRLMDDMPAKAAGVQPNDRIVAVDGTSVRTWDELTKIVRRAANRPLAFSIRRNGMPLTLTVTPKTKEIKDPFGRAESVGLIGIVPSGAFETYRVSPLEAVHKMVVKQAEWISQIGLSLWSLFSGRMSMQESLTGPIGIVYMTSEAAKMGFGPLLYLVSVFSLSLAVFNLFPMPILDGGHLLFIGLEKLRGRAVSLRVQEKATQISFALLVTLAALVCVNDLQRLGVLQKVVGWWKG